MDHQTTLGDLRQLVEEFVAERDWHQFHSPKNLSMSLAIEAGELMEHFQWIDCDQSRLSADDPSGRQEIAAEMADVLCYLLGMANALDLDLSQAVRNKMQVNREKYPAGEFRGRFA